MWILDSCKTITHRKWSIYSAVQVGGARNELHAVQWGGRGSEPTGLGRPLGSKFNFRKKMAQMLLAVLFLLKPTDNTEADQKECGWKFCYPKLQPASSEWVSLTLPFPPWSTVRPTVGTSAQRQRAMYQSYIIITCKVEWGISEYFSGNWLLFLTGSRYWQAAALRRKPSLSSSCNTDFIALATVVPLQYH